MGKINVLDKHVAELIAAGEVVERPSSVVKELVENSVDAGASAVTVEIRNGGNTYMRVTDNGCGISREDVPAAFLRHATSKVRGQEDLERIGTLGFRGEALASVAAVAHVELLTRTQEELAGTHYVISGGEEEDCGDAGCAAGATLVVRDLFYNTPARMKFLKKDVVEANAIASLLDKIALSHPEISVRFLRDGKETLHTPGDGNLKSAVYAVYGKEFTAGLLPVDYELNGVRVWGFVSRPAAARPNRSMQNFFINGRYVRSRTAMVAVEEACKGSLMAGKVPACVLHIAVTFEAVDVNVHPAKTEVRFINERPIFDAVYHGVKTALSRGDTPSVLPLRRPEPNPFPRTESSVQMKMEPRGNTEPESPAAREVRPSVPVARPVSPQPARVPVLNDIEAPRFRTDYRAADIAFTPEPEKTAESSAACGEKKAAPESNSAREEEVPAAPVSPEPPEREKPAEEKPERLVGEAFGTYIILERGEDELVFIDKHAAHERLLYEQLKAQSGEAAQQMLLAPVPVTLDKNEYAAVIESLGVCAQAGFEIEDFGSGTVLVRSAPLILGGEDVAAAVMEIAGYLQSAKNDITTEKLDWLYHNVACRAAVKAGDHSEPQELIALVKRMEREDVRYCPHGRPVRIVLKRKDLERQFGRV